MIKFLVFLLALWSADASAQTSEYWFVNTSPAVYGATLEEACMTWTNRGAPTFVYRRVEVGGATSGNCYATYNSREYFYGTIYKYNCSAATPYWDKTKNTCVSTPPVDPNECADKNPIIRRWDYGSTGATPPPDHFGNCKVTVVELLVCRKDAVTGKTYCMWMVKRTGDRWTGTEAPETGGSSTPDKPSEPPVSSPPIKPPLAPEICSTCRPCPAGTVQAGIGPDGVPMCVGTGTNPPPVPVPPPSTTKPPTTTTGSDGTTVTKQDSVQSNRDGSTTTTTTTTTTAPDGTKTITVSSNTSAATSGSPGRTDANPQDDKYNLCKQNPTLSVCRESSVSGTCGEVTCMGDAIQCATLRAAAAMECKQRSDEDALKAFSGHALGQAAANGNDPAKDTLPSVKNASVVDMGKMEATGWIGGGSPFKDVAFTVQGKSFAVPLSKWTGYLVGLRYALMVVAMLVSFRMLSGVILRD